AGRLEHHRLAAVVEAEPAPFPPDMRRNQPSAARQRHQFQAKFLGGSVRGLPLVVFARHDLVAHKPLGALLQREDVVGYREIHDQSVWLTHLPITMLYKDM